LPIRQTQKICQLILDSVFLTVEERMLLTLTTSPLASACGAETIAKAAIAKMDAKTASR